MSQLCYKTCTQAASLSHLLESYPLQCYKQLEENFKITITWKKKPFHVFILGVIVLGFVFAFNILQLKCKCVNLLHIKFGEKLFLTFHKVSLAVRYHWIFIHAMFNKYLL